MIFRTASLALLPEVPVFVEIIDPPRIGVSVVEAPDLLCYCFIQFFSNAKICFHSFLMFP